MTYWPRAENIWAWLRNDPEDERVLGPIATLITQIENAGVSLSASTNKAQNMVGFRETRKANCWEVGRVGILLHKLNAFAGKYFLIGFV